MNNTFKGIAYERRTRYLLPRNRKNASNNPRKKRFNRTLALVMKKQRSRNINIKTPTEAPTTALSTPVGSSSPTAEAPSTFGTSTVGTVLVTRSSHVNHHVPDIPGLTVGPTIPTVLASSRTVTTARPTYLKITDKSLPKKISDHKTDFSKGIYTCTGDKGTVTICSVSTGNVNPNGYTTEACLVDGPTDENIFTHAERTAEGMATACKPN